MGCSHVLSSYNQRNKLHYFVGNRKVFMKRLNTSISVFSKKTIFLLTLGGGDGAPVQLRGTGEVKAQACAWVPLESVADILCK